MRFFDGNNRPESMTVLMLAHFRIRVMFFSILALASSSFLLLAWFSQIAMFREPLPAYTVTVATSQCNSASSAMLKEVIYNESAIVSQYVGLNGSYNVTPEMWKRLKPAMTTLEKRTLRLILRQFIAISEAMNFTHFQISGTLLGSYRHHGLMPWDDDVDILMRFAERDKILAYFRNYSKEHDIGVETGTVARMKLFHKYRSVPVKHWRYRWPTVDISFYYENTTHLWQGNWKWRYLIIPKDLIFPLHHRPFEMLMINSPFDGFAVLRSLYRNPHCVTLSWVHRTERHPGRILRFQCQTTSSFYPFVERRVNGDCVQEDLVINGEILYSVSVKEPVYAITKPYVLQLIKEPKSDRPKATKQPAKHVKKELHDRPVNRSAPGKKSNSDLLKSTRRPDKQLKKALHDRPVNRSAPGKKPYSYLLKTTREPYKLVKKALPDRQVNRTASRKKPDTDLLKITRESDKLVKKTLPGRQVNRTASRKKPDTDLLKITRESDKLVKKTLPGRQVNRTAPRKKPESDLLKITRESDKQLKKEHHDRSINQSAPGEEPDSDLVKITRQPDKQLMKALPDLPVNGTATVKKPK